MGGRVKALLKAEFYKLYYSVGYRLILAFCIGRSIWNVSFYSWRKAWIEGNGLTGFTAWDWFGYVPVHTGGYLFYLCFFAAIFIAGELRTGKCSEAVKFGKSRNEIFSAKMIVFLAGSLLICAVYAMTQTFAWSLEYGWGSYSVFQVAAIILKAAKEFCYSTL